MPSELSLMTRSRQKVLMVSVPGDARFIERELPEPGSRDVVVRPLLSTFKHGTEMMAYSGRSPFARRTFDPELRLFEDRKEPADFFPRPMGSMMVGEVEWAGPEGGTLSAGQTVYGWAPIADRHILPADQVAPLQRLRPEEALCIDPASFALGAVIDGAIAASDRVLVTGLGAIGLFVVQYCAARGAHVIAASRFEKRRNLAARFGAADIRDPAAEDDLGRSVKSGIGGVDAAIECSGNIGTLAQSIRTTKQCGRVVCVGFYGPADSRLNLGEEFFHNRITLLASLPALSWNNPTRGEPPRYAKDLQHQVVSDFAAKVLTAEGILEPVLPFTDAERAVRLIAETPEVVIKILLRH
jgi:threonine dehydrogenase-like Zn-dependent dehydrogenase